MNPRITLWLLRTITVLIAIPVTAGTNEERWFPTQRLPKTIIRTANQQEFPEPRLSLQMMAQSVAGLAAKAVNEGRGSELVWVNNGDGDLEKWYASFVSSHPALLTTNGLRPWELVDRYARQRIIKGYILYSSRDAASNSVNVATSLAGLLDGIIVDEKLETEAVSRGLKLLIDVRNKTQAWCFQTYRDQFNRRMLCCQDSQKPHVRDFAIAHRVFTMYGNDEWLLRSVMAWLEPLSPVLGWNSGDEFASTDLSSGYGDIQTATDWCLNLPVLMVGSEKIENPRAKSFDPRTIDWNDKRSAVAFVDTDGDNTQWLQGNFASNPSYWGNSERGRIPFGWSCCFAHLAQLCPQAAKYLMQTRTTNDWFIEWGGGYYYPDHFGRDRTNRWELLARQASRTWNLMKKTNTRIIGFDVTDDSTDTRKACQIFASQTDGLLGILTFEYSAYEGGAGKIFWVKDRNGVKVPVISARYSIWENLHRDRAGTPAKVAREIRDTVANGTPGQPRYDWVIAHAWSYFKRAPGSDENAENMPQEMADTNGGIRGYSPVLWCAERLPPNMRVISPEELIWRIRMQEDPAETKRLIGKLH